MKAGIISEFNLDTVNYGNHLQAYALNRYLRMQYPELAVESIPRGKNFLKKYRTNLPLSLVRKVKRLLGLTAKYDKAVSPFYADRNRNFRQFASEHICMPEKAVTWKGLQRSDYDILIAGSDVVWYQSDTVVARERFLDFKNRRNAKKLSYAASFGNDFIPACNRRYIAGALRSFAAISVREEAAVALLSSIGVDGAVHVCDPTLLLTAEEWAEIEQKPALQAPDGSGGMDAGSIKYVFAYLFGESAQTWKSVLRFCRENGLKLVTIPQVSGYRCEKIYGDYIVPACSPQEWIWLVHHAAYVVTDSFHGVVFSTIFSRKFLAAMTRSGGGVEENEGRSKLGGRVTDYLHTIGQADKLCGRSAVGDMASMEWEYEQIHKKMDDFIAFSKRFIQEAI